MFHSYFFVTALFGGGNQRRKKNVFCFEFFLVSSHSVENGSHNFNGKVRMAFNVGRRSEHLRRGPNLGQWARMAQTAHNLCSCVSSGCREAKHCVHHCSGGFERQSVILLSFFRLSACFSVALNAMSSPLLLRCTHAEASWMCMSLKEHFKGKLHDLESHLSLDMF